jgi:hypothetical protein
MRLSPAGSTGEKCTAGSADMASGTDSTTAAKSAASAK